ncbi:ABC transporter permease [Paenibacillus sp. GCM10023252]|uniref:ABC transporter permease n=1 Tax=Paenibacillus sp. GCM10023252 TaxID=3252649 RepID=UPI00361BB934
MKNRSSQGQSSFIRLSALLRKNGELSTLFLPGFIYIFIMAYLPMIGIIIAFKDYRVDLGLFGSEWVGLEKFRFFFENEASFTITRNTVLYSLTYLTTTTIAALALAIMMNELTRKWIKVHQTVMFLPFFMSWVLVAYVAEAFLEHEHGYLNRVLEWVGAEPVMWYFEPAYWPYILVIANLWKGIGFSTLIYYAGLISIDTSYYEAAKMDGAGRWQMVWRITLPMLTPLITILMILSIGSMFRGDFGLHYFLPKNTGTLYPATDIIDTYVFRALRDVGDISMSAAIGLYQSFVGFLLVIGANYITRRINEENSLW